MSAIVLLSVDADAERAGIILNAMSEFGLDVWWEQIGADDKRVSRDVRERVEAARCVVLVLSRSSLETSAVSFARLAEQRAIAQRAICVAIDHVLAPPQLAACTCYDLRGWRSQPNWLQRLLGSSLYMRDLLAAARAKAAGSDPPPPSAARVILLRGLAFFGAPILAGLGLAATLLGAWTDLGLGDRPSVEEELAWKSLKPGVCADLREFVSTHPGGHYARQAQALLSGQSTRTSESWPVVETPLKLHIPAMDAPPRSSREAAEALARERGQKQARNDCRGFERPGVAQVRGARLGEGSISCQPVGGQFVCSFHGDAICSVAERRDVEVETCGRL